MGRMEVDMFVTEEMVDAELPNFVAKLQEQFDEHYAKNLNNLQSPFVFVAGGRKYIKIARKDNQTSVICFVRAADGAILKAASWKAPALNFTRGSIFQEKFPFMCYGL